MKILVTGSTGHLGEALLRTLQNTHHETIGLDLLPSAFTNAVGSVTDRDHVRRSMVGVDAVFHTATLHKPHVCTHSRQDFVDTNITGTLILLEEAAKAGVRAFIFTSTTSTFGHALVPPTGSPAAWITEEVTPIPKNIYGVTKTAAENLCELFHRNHQLPCIILRVARFFLEADDSKTIRDAYTDNNIKANEFLYRRVELEDVVSAHLCALARASDLRFGRYIISATTPFQRSHLPDLRRHAPHVVKELFPDYPPEYARRCWQMFPAIERVYVNERSRQALGWQPRHDFRGVLDRLQAGEELRSPLAKAVGSKGYHPYQAFADGPYPVDHL